MLGRGKVFLSLSNIILARENRDGKRSTSKWWYGGSARARSEVEPTSRNVVVILREIGYCYFEQFHLCRIPALFQSRMSY